MNTEKKKQRKPRATADEQIQTLFLKLSKAMSRKAKQENNNNSCDVIESDGPSPKADILKSCDDIILAIKNLKKAIRKI